MANSGVSLCQLGLSRSTSEPYWKMSSLFPSPGLAQVSKLHSSIRGGTHRVPGTPSHPSVLSILVLSLQHRLCSLRVPIKPVRGAVAGPHPPSRGAVVCERPGEGVPGLDCQLAWHIA